MCAVCVYNAIIGIYNARVLYMGSCTRCIDAGILYSVAFIQLISFGGQTGCREIILL